MATSYVGEIRMFGGNFAPAGWMFCEGQVLPISEWETLFNLIGTTYGGDGQSTFALPDLRGRVPLHFGNGFTQAEIGGSESVQLTLQQIPLHNHTPFAQSNSGSSGTPANSLWAASSLNSYSSNPPDTPMSPAAVGMTGGSQPHENRQPFLCVSFIMSMFGIFPSQT